MGELFDVLALLADQGPDCLSWNKEVDNLLFWSLLLENKTKKGGTQKKNILVHFLLSSPADGGREKHLKLL